MMTTRTPGQQRLVDEYIKRGPSGFVIVPAEPRGVCGAAATGHGVLRCTKRAGHIGSHECSSDSKTTWYEDKGGY